MTCDDSEKSKAAKECSSILQLTLKKWIDNVVGGNMFGNPVRSSWTGNTTLTKLKEEFEVNKHTVVHNNLLLKYRLGIVYFLLNVQNFLSTNGKV